MSGNLTLRCTLAALAVVLLAAPVPAQEWQWDDRPGQLLALKRGETVVWQFLYGPNQPKPLFHPVGLPDGRVLTWNRPPDHDWHHGLWFAWKYLNGVNYWEPADRKTGRFEGVTRWANVKTATCPDGSARIEMDLSYSPAAAPAAAPPVLVEKRIVAASAPNEEGQYHFDWTSTFTAGEKDVELGRTPIDGQPGGVPWGGYAGLSIRLAKELTDRAAVSTEGPVEFEGARHHSKALALDYHGLIGGRPLGMAVCDHPDNLNHPTPWYVIRGEPMSYFSPAVIYFGPHTLKAGQSFTLRYRIIVHPGRWDAETLEREYQRFVEESGGR